MARYFLLWVLGNSYSHFDYYLGPGWPALITQTLHDVRVILPVRSNSCSSTTVSIGAVNS